MKIAYSLKNYKNTASLLLLLLAFVSTEMFEEVESSPKQQPTSSLTDFSNITLCAPINRFDISMEDIARATRPLAPKLFPKWQTQLDITSESKEALSLIHI